MMADEANDTITMENVMEETELEGKYIQETELRDQLQLQVKECQAELEGLVAKQPKRPREKLSEIDEKIASLEKDRTLNSIDLKDEREILKQMAKLERVRKDVIAFEEHDKTIKEKKAHIYDLKEQLKDVRTNADRLRTESRLAKTALQVGCKKEELVGTKVVCPQDKLGEIIGKKGSNVKQLQAAASVTVNVRKEGDAQIVGSMEALDAATSNLLKVIDSVEVSLPNPNPDLVAYLTCKNVTALSELSEKHPNVRLSVQRAPKMSITLKGLPEDVERLQKELLGMNVVTKVLHMTDAESASVVGKQGANIENLTTVHQVAIDVTRRRPSVKKAEEDDGKEGSDDKKKAPSDNNKKGSAKEVGKSTVTVTGPPSNVEEATKEVERLASLAREMTHSIEIDPVAKNAMLINGGAGIQALTKRLNDQKESGFVYATCDGNHVVLRGRAHDVPTAVPVAEAEIRRVESLIVKVPVDAVVIPTLIGKGGETIKSIRDGKPVVIEIVDQSVVVVGGTDSTSVAAAVEAVQAVLAGNAVRRMSIEAGVYRQLSGEFVRYQSRAIGAICKMSMDDDKCQVVLRGSPEKVAEAEDVVNKFLANNYMEDIDVANEDLTVLLLGGKSSKITELSGSLGVRLSADKTRNVVVVRGEQEKVVAAVKAVKQFLFGGNGVTVVRVVLSEQVLGMVIGKGGKNKAELQKKYPNLSITVGSDNSILTLRGPEAEAEACRIELLKLVAGAQVTESISISSKVHERFSEKTASRDILRDIPVQFTLSDDAIKVRGYAPDVRDAVSLLNEAIHGKYESRMVLPPPQFAQIKNACRNETSSPLQRAMDASGSSVVLDSTDDALVFRGKRSQVKAAKVELFNFFDFLFGSAFTRMELAGPLVTLVGRVPILSEISAVSGASIQLDRDTSFLLVFSNDSTSMEKASEALKSKIEEASKLFFELRFDPSEAVIVSTIIGKKGDQINKLRKSTKCDIEVDIDSRTVLVKSKSAELTSQARSTLDELVDKARRENIVISMSDADLPAFIGKAGARIAEFADKYDVETKTIRNSTPPSIRITGSEAAVAAAKAAALEWLKERDAARKEAETVETMRLRRDQVPVVIGTKGSTIRSLQTEFGCKVEVDREALIASVRGGNTEKRAQALGKIKEILAAAREIVNQATDDEDDAGVDVPAAASSSQDDAKPAPKAESMTPPRVPRTEPSAPPKVPEPSDFPELVTTPSRKETAKDHREPSSPPHIRSSATCSTVDSSKDGDEDPPGIKWSHVVVASRPPAEVAADVVDGEQRWGDADSDASGEEEKPYSVEVAVPAMKVIDP